MSMNSDCIEREILIEAPPEVVWGVITEPEQISRWFSDSADLEARPGAFGLLGWDEHGRYDLRVERVEPHRVFSWRWVYPPDAEPDASNSLLVEFTLREEQAVALRDPKRG
jgi:uncharacterized protein YndB with AHSA1/START domain